MSSERMRYIQVAIDVFEHPKIYALARILGREADQAWPPVVRFWSYVMHYHQAGDITPVFADPEPAARFCRLPVEEMRALLRGMLAVGLIDLWHNKTYRIHDWSHASGALQDRRDRDAKRQRRYRATIGPASMQRPPEPTTEDEDIDAPEDDHEPVTTSEKPATGPVTTPLDPNPPQPQKSTITGGNDSALAPAIKSNPLRDSHTIREEKREEKKREEESREDKTRQEQGARGSGGVPPAGAAPALPVNPDKPPVASLIGSFNLFFNPPIEMPKQKFDPNGECYRHIADAWRAHPDHGWWIAYFQRAGLSPFLKGRKKDFVADFWWLIEPANMEKVLAGKYDVRPTPHAAVEFILEHLRQIVDWRHQGFVSATPAMTRVAGPVVAAVLLEMARNGDMGVLLGTDEDRAPFIVPKMVNRVWEAAVAASGVANAAPADPEVEDRDAAEGE